MGDEALKAFRKVRHGAGHPLGAGFGHGAVQTVHRFDQRGEIQWRGRRQGEGRGLCGHRLHNALAHRRKLGRGGLAADVAHRGGEPVLQVGIEAVLRLTRLKVEEAEHQRAGKAEQRGRKGNAHAAERRGQPALDLLEHRAAVGPHFQRADDVADGGDGFQKAPEGAEQAEKHQEAREIAGSIARLVQPCADGIEDRAHGGLGNGHPADPVPQQRGHGRQQRRRAGDGEAGIGQPEGIHPVHFGKQPRHLPDGENDADGQDAENDAVEARIVQEGIEDLPVEHGGECRAEPQEDNHPDEKDARGRYFNERVDDPRHVRSRRSRPCAGLWHT